jgi:hypothetical protein
MIISDLQRLTKPYADARGQLAEIVTELNRDIEALKRRQMPVIRQLVARAAEHESNLRAAIEAHQDLFIQPRTVVFHGIKLGLQKGKGGIEWDDADKVLARIHAEYGDDANGLIHIAETPDKKMLADLPADELKKLGCRLVNTGDEVIVRPTDTGVDKIVSALLKDALEDGEARRVGE